MIKQMPLLKAILIGVIIVSIAFAPVRIDSQSLGRQAVKVFKNNPSRALSNKYLLFLPPEYGERKSDWPLIVFLHGGSARGRDIGRLRRYVLPGYLEKGRYPVSNFPFIVVSPQYVYGKTWRDNAEALFELIEEVCSELPVDANRIYMAGPSMGGQGTWFIASRYPNRFAAIAPVAAVKAAPEWTGVVKEMPVWVFQGKRDSDSPFRVFKVLKRKLAAAPSCRITVYDQDHIGTIHSAYQNKELYTWFLRQNKS